MVAKWAGVLSELRVVGYVCHRHRALANAESKAWHCSVYKGVEPQRVANRFNPRHVALLSMCVRFLHQANRPFSTCVDCKFALRR